MLTSHVPAVYRAEWQVPHLGGACAFYFATIPTMPWCPPPWWQGIATILPCICTVVFPIEGNPFCFCNFIRKQKWERKNNRVIWKGRSEVLWALDSLSRSLIKEVKEDGALLNEQNIKTRPMGLAQTIWNLQAGLQPTTCTWPKENDFYCSTRLPPGRAIYSLPC